MSVLLLQVEWLECRGSVVWLVAEVPVSIDSRQDIWLVKGLHGLWLLRGESYQLHDPLLQAIDCELDGRVVGNCGVL